MSTEKHQNIDNFASFLKIACEKFGFNQPQLSKKTGLSTGLISMYLNGKSEPGYLNIKKISGAFGLTVAQFFSLPDDDMPPVKEIEPSAPAPPGDWPQIKAEYDTIKALLAGQIKATNEQTSALGEIIAAAIKSVRDEERDKMLAERETHIKQLERDIKELKEDRDRLRTKVESNILTLVRERGAGRKNAA